MLNLSAFAEQMLVHEHACVRIDAEMPLDRAAVIGCAVTTGAGTVFNACKVTPGETVAASNRSRQFGPRNETRCSL